MTHDLGDGPLLAFYGDDFTGSTDAMEVTAKAGLPTVLFTRPPDSELRAKFADYPVVGIAGTSRSRDPEWMERELPTLFESLAATGAPILQYKVCSTFDSAPGAGSIGRAIEIGARVLDAGFLPVVVGAPELGRWVTFATLFARAGDGVHRIDRHPTMSRHPVTPMTEGDLTRHLAAQTDRPVAALSLDRLATPAEAETVAQARKTGEILVLDTFDRSSQIATGRLVWEERAERIFTAASSGLQYALTAYWRDRGLISETRPEFPPLTPTPNLLVLSGSCSPITAQQISIAEEAGFTMLRLDVVAVADGQEDDEVQRLLGEALPTLKRDQPVLIFTARTVDDPAYSELSAYCERRGIPFSQAQSWIGKALGRIARDVVPAIRSKRIAVAGGDTSGSILDHLPVDALELHTPLAPGAPLCRCHSEDPIFDGLEILLKGGQLGTPTVFRDLAFSEDWDASG